MAKLYHLPSSWLFHLKIIKIIHPGELLGKLNYNVEKWPRHGVNINYSLLLLLIQVLLTNSFFILCNSCITLTADHWGISPWFNLKKKKKRTQFPSLSWNPIWNPCPLIGSLGSVFCSWDCLLPPAAAQLLVVCCIPLASSDTRCSSTWLLMSPSSGSTRSIVDSRPKDWASWSPSCSTGTPCLSLIAAFEVLLIHCEVKTLTGDRVRSISVVEQSWTENNSSSQRNLWNRKHPTVYVYITFH